MSPRQINRLSVKMPIHARARNGAALLNGSVNSWQSERCALVKLWSSGHEEPPVE